MHVHQLTRTEPNGHRRLFALITCVAVPSLSALAAAITAAVLR